MTKNLMLLGIGEVKESAYIISIQKKVVLASLKLWYYIKEHSLDYKMGNYTLLCIVGYCMAFIGMLFTYSVC